MKKNMFILTLIFCFSAFASNDQVSRVLDSNLGKMEGVWSGRTRDIGKPCILSIDTYANDDYWVSIENFYYKSTGVGPFLDNTSEFTLRQMSFSRSNSAVIIDIRQSVGWPFSIKKGRMYKLIYDRSLKFVRYELSENDEAPAICKLR